MSGTSAQRDALYTMVEVDLDDLAEAYRLRPMTRMARSRAVASARNCSGLLLDIGGGTGHHAAQWLGPNRLPIVVDPSLAMLRMARAQSGVVVVQARSQSLPVAEKTAGLAYFHLSIHYGDWRSAIDEAFRVVEFGGRIEIWTMDHTAIERSSLGRWFPRVVEIDLERFPDTDAIARYCRSTGSSVEMTRTNEPIERTASDWSDAVRGRFVSTLQFLDDDEVEEGLSRFAVEYREPDSLYRYELGLTRISTIVRPLL
jgi:ubiquinone/menaquinone biosynthesis C-methylase UbiE